MRFISLRPSTRKDKRFMYEYLDENDKKKVIHFGFKGGQSYLEHNDAEKRKKYIARHKAGNEDWSKINAGALSRYILWGDTNDLQKNLKAFNTKFRL
jgi:hypothetical protein